MDHMYVELDPDVGQYINDKAEQLGCDYGPVLGFFLALGLDRHGLAVSSKEARELAWKQYLHSAKLTGIVGPELTLPDIPDAEPPL